MSTEPPPDTTDFDPQLRALFRMAEPEASLEDGFTRHLLQRLQRRRRSRLLGRTAGAAVVAAVLGVGAAMTPALPWLERTIAVLPLAAARETSPLGAWLVTPAGWLVSLLLGTAVMWRAKALRR